MEKVKAKVVEGLEKVGKIVHGDCDSCLGVKTIVVAVLMLLIVIG
jgi:hypothetical protein